MYGCDAKSLQSCPTLCNPVDGSPPGSPIPGILQARTLEWVANSFSNAWKWKVKVKSLSHIWLLETRGLQPTRLLCPWDFPGESTGVGCHCLLQWMWELDYKESWVLKNWCFWAVVLEKTLESPLDCKETQPVHPKGNQSVHWKDWCWSWISNTLATWCEELTHLKRSQCWERLKAGREEDDREWDGWMASLTQWTWVWVISTSWWWTGKPGMPQSTGSQRVKHDWVTELNWLPIAVLQIPYN